MYYNIKYTPWECAVSLFFTPEKQTGFCGIRRVL